MEKAKLKSFLKMPLTELVAVADKVRAKRAGKKIELCGIMNAKSGLCSEDCKFCAQSGRHKTHVDTYALKSVSDIVKAAKRAKALGAERFGIVTSGNRLKEHEIENIAKAVRKIRQSVDIKVCASLGNLDEADLALLKDAGISRYHHNIETSRRFFSEIVTTHTFDERIDTIGKAKRVGLEVCSGGIIGMGETWADRIDMALTLRELGVTSVPINMLVAVKGTALESAEPLSCVDAIRTIAVFRIVLGDKILRLAAGRESVLKDFEAMAFMAGANGMMIGGYLTTQGRNVDDDRVLVKKVETGWRR